MSRYFKITLVGKKKSFFLQGDRRPDGWFLGLKVDPETAEPLSSASYMKAGVEYETKDLIQPEAVAKFVEYYEDLKYGGLTCKTREQQRKEYGF